ncbi:MAG: hypothetical protein K0U54_07930 [Bacteroidetes bacterium]|nr:hypothetical protein [Bacteroidota bacterium]
MKLKLQSLRIVQTFFYMLIFSTTFAQVGIGTTNPNPNSLLDIDASSTAGGLLLPRLVLSSLTDSSPLSAHVNGMIVYNTVTINDVTPGLYYNDGTKWIRVDVDQPSFDSVSLAADYSLGAGGYTDVPTMTLTFVAQTVSALITLSGSGGASPELAAGIGDFQVVNVDSGAVIGGTHEKLTTFDDVYGVVSAAWSLSFTKPISGLTIGQTYTLKVQAFVDPILTFSGTPQLQINAATEANHHHLTLSVTH